MSSMLTPRRRRGYEYLEAPDVEPAIELRSLRDVARSNTLFGGTQAVLSELESVFASLRRRSATLLDVGTGAGDIPCRAHRAAAGRGIALTTIGVEVSAALARAAAGKMLVVRADGLQLPFADHSIDVVICSQLLHHFEQEGACALLHELNRVARHRVIVSDLRRSWLAAAGIWLASFPLGFHPVSRHDGVVSVLRGFTAPELADLVHSATGADASVRDRPGFRTTASWMPPGSEATS